MNEVLKAISERFSCRDFEGTPIADDQINAIVKAAVASPSGMNRQPWNISVITDKAFIEEMDKEGMNILYAAEDKSTGERMKSRGGKLFYNAPLMIMVASDGSDCAALDCGILSQSIAIAAHSLGLGSVICGMAAIPLNGSRGEEFKKRMQFPKGYNFGIAVLVGKVKTGKEPHEADMGKVIFV